MKVDRKLTRKMLKRHGWETEKTVIFEEFAELEVEICHAERKRKHVGYDLIEEVADVYIVLDMIAEHFGISAEQIQAMIDYKEQRNTGRLKEDD